MTNLVKLFVLYFCNTVPLVFILLMIQILKSEQRADNIYLLENLSLCIMHPKE